MGNKIFIIAEAGVNHNGDINLARQLIDCAAEAGADAVKFQTFRADKLVSYSAPKAGYQLKSTPKSESQLEMIKRLELSSAAHSILMQHCATRKIQFLSSPFDTESADFLLSLGQKIFKIPSGEIVNIPFLQHIGTFGKEVILSSGMSTLGEIETAIEILVNAGTSIEKITVLHCNTEYPTPFEDVNLKAMNTIHNSFGVKTGYSDHTMGIEIPIAAAALGAVVIEKHFTLNRNMEGPDHKASLEPDELRQMVQAIRNIEKSLGDGIKCPSKSEMKNIVIARKSLHYSRNIVNGTTLKKSDIVIKRPGNGLPPSAMDLVVGLTLLKDVLDDTIVKMTDFQ